MGDNAAVADFLEGAYRGPARRAAPPRERREGDDQRVAEIRQQWEAEGRQLPDRIPAGRYRGGGIASYTMTFRADEAYTITEIDAMTAWVEESNPTADFMAVAHGDRLPMKRIASAAAEYSDSIEWGGGEVYQGEVRDDRAVLDGRTERVVIYIRPRIRALGDNTQNTCLLDAAGVPEEDRDLVRHFCGVGLNEKIPIAHLGEVAIWAGAGMPTIIDPRDGALLWVGDHARPYYAANEHVWPARHPNEAIGCEPLIADLFHQKTKLVLVDSVRKTVLPPSGTEPEPMKGRRIAASTCFYQRLTSGPESWAEFRAHQLAVRTGLDVAALAGGDQAPKIAGAARFGLELSAASSIADLAVRLWRASIPSGERYERLSPVGEAIYRQAKASPLVWWDHDQNSYQGTSYDVNSHYPHTMTIVELPADAGAIVASDEALRECLTTGGKIPLGCYHVEVTKWATTPGPPRWSTSETEYYLSSQLENMRAGGCAFQPTNRPAVVHARTVVGPFATFVKMMRDMRGRAPNQWCANYSKTAKNLLNSLWGKLGARARDRKLAGESPHDEYLLASHVDGSETRRRCDRSAFTGPLPHWCLFIVQAARQRILEVAKGLPVKRIHTDSLVLAVDGPQPDPSLIGSEIGQLKVEKQGQFAPRHVNDFKVKQAPDPLCRERENTVPEPTRPAPISPAPASPARAGPSVTELTRVDCMIDSRYLPPINEICPPGARVIAIRSPCGSGKSTQLGNWVGPRAVYVSHRRSHATQIAKRLGFVDYRAVRGQIELEKTPRVVVQVESLSRINPAGLPFDLVLDEWCSLLRQFNADLAVRRGAFRHLERLCAGAARIIALDGHLADADVAALALVAKAEPFVVHNTCRPYDGATYKIYPKPAASLQSLLDHAAAGGRACVVFHSKTALEATKVILAKRLPDCKVLAYTSESSGADRRAFENVDEAWREAQIVMYTSTVEVGIDLTLPEFHVFVFISSPDVTATQTAQMAFRARAVREIHIAVEASAAAARRLRASPENVFDLRAVYTSWGEHADLPADLQQQTELSPEGLSRIPPGNTRAEAWFVDVARVGRARNGRTVKDLCQILESVGFTNSAAADVPIDKPTAAQYREAGEAAVDRVVDRIANAMPGDFLTAAFEGEAPEVLAREGLAKQLDIPYGSVTADIVRLARRPGYIRAYHNWRSLKAGGLDLVEALEAKTLKESEQAGEAPPERRAVFMRDAADIFAALGIPPEPKAAIGGRVQEADRPAALERLGALMRAQHKRENPTRTLRATKTTEESVWKWANKTLGAEFNLALKRCGKSTNRYWEISRSEAEYWERI